MLFGFTHGDISCPDLPIPPLLGNWRSQASPLKAQAPQIMVVIAPLVSLKSLSHLQQCRGRGDDVYTCGHSPLWGKGQGRGIPYANRRFPADTLRCTDRFFRGMKGLMLDMYRRPAPGHYRGCREGNSIKKEPLLSGYTKKGCGHLDHLHLILNVN